jgi:hypothetical protein
MVWSVLLNIPEPHCSCRSPSCRLCPCLVQPVLRWQPVGLARQLRLGWHELGLALPGEQVGYGSETGLELFPSRVYSTTGGVYSTSCTTVEPMGLARQLWPGWHELEKAEPEGTRDGWLYSRLEAY